MTLSHLEDIWELPDQGIWEMRGASPIYVSKVMAWVALDRSVRDAERFRLEAPLEWRELRDRMHATICKRGFDAVRRLSHKASAQRLDASLLLLPS